LISYAFPPMGVVGSHRAARICRYAALSGWLPEVVTTYPRRGLPLDDSLLRTLPSTVTIHRTKTFEPLFFYQRIVRPRTTFTATPRESNNQPGALIRNKLRHRGALTLLSHLNAAVVSTLTTPDRQAPWVLYAIREGARILLRNRSIVFILTTSPPHSSQIAGIALSRFFDKPHIADFRDPWIDTNFINRGYLRSAIESYLESLVIRTSKYIISTSDTYTQALIDRYKPAEPERFLTVTNAYEPEDFTPPSHTTANSNFTLAYLGIFYNQLYPYAIFSAIASWLNQDSQARHDTRVLIIGPVDPQTAAVVANMRLQGNVEFTGRLPHTEAIRCARCSHLLLLCTGTGPRTPKGWIPSKLFEYLACRQPILAIVPEGDAAAIIRATRTGYVFTNDDPRPISNVLQQEYKRYKAGLSATGQSFNPNISEIARYSAPIVMAKMLSLFEQLAHHH
jgi:glycosyltransferase involved in cell wall biosynthesis